MKKEINFPKGAKSINIDLENGIATAIYEPEEEKSALKVGKWYYNIWAKIYILILNNGTHYEIDSSNRCYISGYKTSVLKVKDYKTADMCKVEKLLIGEAEKRGFKEGVNVNQKPAYGEKGLNGVLINDNRIDFSHGNLAIGGVGIFSSEFGKWAGIIEENKDIFLNAEEWYTSSRFSGTWLVLKSYANSIKCVGFGRNGKWKRNYIISGLSDMIPADMVKVEKLLIGEAEKRGCSEGVKIGPVWAGGNPDRLNKITNNTFKFLNGNLYCGNWIVFSSGNGVWARIVRKKKPLFINSLYAGFFEGDEYSYVDKATNELITRGNLSKSVVMIEDENSTEIMTVEECNQWIEEHPIPLYTSLDGKGTEFFEGDKIWYIEKETKKIIPTYIQYINKLNYIESEGYTEIMTKKECYQYLADNCES